MITRPKDITILLNTFLGRNPSDSAIRELSQRPFNTNVAWILTSDEFRRNVTIPLFSGSAIIHDVKRIKFGQLDKDWLLTKLPMSVQGRNSIMLSNDWQRFFANLVIDIDIISTVKSSLVDSVERLKVFEDDISLISKAFADKSDNFGSTRESISLDTTIGYQNSEKKLKRSTILNQGGGISVAQSVDLAAHKLKMYVSNLFKDNEWSMLLDVCDAIIESSNDASKIDYVKFIVSRFYLRFFMSETSYQITNEILKSGRPLELFSATDRRRLMKTNALAAMRSGRADEGLFTYRTLSSEDPLDWEPYFFMADFLIQTDPVLSERYFRSALKCKKILSASHLVTIADTLDRGGDRATFVQILHQLSKFDRVPPDFHTLMANASLREQCTSSWRKHISEMFESQGLTGKDMLVSGDNGLFPFGESDVEQVNNNPLISVIMTCHNARDTVRSAVRSVLRQTLANVEIIIIDDMSSDDSRQILSEISLEDSRVKLLFNSQNMGTYCSKNSGIEIARGEFVTFHDSDDWMHPQRLERHLDAMASSSAASVSNWIRMASTGEAVLRRGGGFVHRNPASTFIKAECLKKVGYFDSVRTGADTEMLWRLKHTFGIESVVEFNDVLALGLNHDKSLTTSGAAAFDEFRYSPVRLDYWESWVSWQLDSVRAQKELYLPRVQRERKFRAPEAIQVDLLKEA